MRKIVIIATFLLCLLTHGAMRTAQCAYALRGKDAKQEPKAAAEVIEKANVRLEAKIEGLSRQNESLRNEAAALKSEINDLNRDRNHVINKLKVITEENSKLKEQLEVLQQGLVDLDIARKELSTVNVKQTDEIKSLEKKAQPVRKVREDSNRKIRELKEEIAGYKQEISALKKESSQARKNEASTSSKLEKEEALSARMKDDINELKDKNKELLEAQKGLQKDLKKALSDLANSNKDMGTLKRELADTHYNLGVIFQKENRWEEAIREYEKVLETMPDDADTNFNLAIIYDTVKNDRGKALYHYKRYLDICPDADDAAKVKGYITDINTKNAVWGEPGAKNIREKKGRW
jgi:chromosome segregation ATPase